jgi:plastocyanin
MRSRTLALLAVMALPLLAACGDDAGSPAGAQAAAAPAAAPARAQAAAAPAARTISVGMAGSQFGPATADVQVGDTVVFKNDDGVAHTTTATEGASFDSGTMEPGATFEYVIKRAGTLAYFCEFHTGMTGTLTVR